MPNQTGPKGPGKFTSCMNNLRHGCASESLFIKGEKPAEFFALLDNAFEQHRPVFDQDAILVTRSVRANWILLRRERIADRFEVLRIDHYTDGKDLDPHADLKELDRFDRYITTADRRFTRALRNVQLVQKMARDDERWQMKLAQQKEEIKTDPAIAAFLDSFIAEPEIGSEITQNVFAAFDEKGELIAADVSPKNETIAEQPVPPKTIIRAYHFKGKVPTKYHWFMTEAQQRTQTYQEIRKSLTFAEWQSVIAKE